ncbi:MAG: hypothetical protein ACI9AP_001427, partial [Flavobacteriales bacterium]
TGEPSARLLLDIIADKAVYQSVELKTEITIRESRCLANPQNLAYR